MYISSKNFIDKLFLPKKFKYFEINAIAHLTFLLTVAVIGCYQYNMTFFIYEMLITFHIKNCSQPYAVSIKQQFKQIDMIEFMYINKYVFISPLLSIALNIILTILVKSFSFDNYIFIYMVLLSVHLGYTKQRKKQNGQEQKSDLR